jgi:RNA polymerase sigma factor for flagellar operon FliA
MHRAPLANHQQQRVAASLPFVESLARRMASTMPHSIDLGDLVQDGVLGLIDAAHRFDEDRGIKFETFAERRVRGAMIDALRRELGAEPTLADLAKRVGSDEARLERTIVRISTIESTSPLANFEGVDSATLPAVLVPSEPPSPDRVYEQTEVRDRVRQALAKLPARERRIVSLYYFGEATMKQIGEEIGVNESRVSQLHARAIERLRKVMTAGLPVERPKLVPKPTRPKFIRTAAKKTGKIGTPRLVA